MRAEKLILSFVAVLGGLLVAGVAFYLYQSTKTVSPNSVKTITITHPSPTPAASVFLSIDSPTDEAVLATKVVTVSGKTDPQATLLVTTPTTDTVVTPSTEGAFSLTVTLSDSETPISITAIMPNGAENQKTITVGYASDNF